MNDELLIKKARKGDEEAFFKFMQMHKEQLYKTALIYLKNDQDALEAIQEVTFRAYKSIKKLKKPQYAKTWLIRIMIFYCLDELKRRKRVVMKEADPGSIDHDPSLRMTLDESISKLESKYQTVIILKYFHDLTLSEIASGIERPEGTVKTWLHKGLGKLRNQMKREEGAYESQ